MSALGGKLPLAHQRFTRLRPATPSARRLDQPVFDEELDGFLTSSNTLVVNPIAFSDVLCTHQSKGP
jgi:hypothetical protein